MEEPIAGPDDRGIDGEALFDHIADGLRRDGWVLVHDPVPPPLTQALFRRVRDLPRAAFDRAGIGREAEHQHNRFVRGDEIRWLDAGNAEDAAWLSWCEGLRLAMNRRLILGLFEYEAHFAHYPPGTFYRRHLDCFQGSQNRRLTTVFYLNPGWTLTDGGELLLWSGAGSPANAEPLARIQPGMGQLLVFLSEEFPHEVRPARRDRYSIAGWFRVRETLPERHERGGQGVQRFLNADPPPPD